MLENKRQHGGVGEEMGDVEETEVSVPPSTHTIMILAKTGMGSLKFMSWNRKQMIIYLLYLALVM